MDNDEVINRAFEWLSIGGFFNPELMSGDKTRHLIHDLVHHLKNTDSEFKKLDRAWLNAEGKIEDLKAQYETLSDKYVNEIRKNAMLQAEIDAVRAITQIALDGIEVYESASRIARYKPWWRR